MSSINQKKKHLRDNIDYEIQIKKSINILIEIELQLKIPANKNIAKCKEIEDKYTCRRVCDQQKMAKEAVERVRNVGNVTAELQIFDHYITITSTFQGITV